MVEQEKEGKDGMKMIRKLNDFKRSDLFHYYNERHNPFLMVTVKVDVTNVVKYCKESKNSVYATIGYLVVRSISPIDAFKYRYVDGEFYYCEDLIPGFTQMKDDETIGFFNVDYTEDYQKFIAKYNFNKRMLLENNALKKDSEINEVWLSCAPWFSFTGLVVPFDKKITIPQFIWDKYVLDDERYYINMMIMVHHGFADGYHVGVAIKALEESIKNFGE